MTAALRVPGIDDDVFAVPGWTAELVDTADPHTPDWHAARAQGIGGSEVAAILGLSPWASPYSLWHAKANGWTSDPDDEMAWGNYLEPILVDWFFDHTPGAVRVGPASGLYRHRGRRWQRASPDALAVIDGQLEVVEAKKASSDDEWGAPGTDEVPAHYRVQVIWYLDVLGCRRARIVVTNLGRAPQVYVVDYDAEEARLLRGHAARFWRSLQQGQVPDLDGTAHTLQTVRRLHPLIDGTAVYVDPALASEWTGAKTALKRAQTAANLAAARLLDAMGTARYAVVPDPTQLGGARRVARRQPAAGGSVALYQL